MRILLGAGLMVLVLGGCTRPVPVQTNLNDFLTMSVKSYSTGPVSLSYDSAVKDGEIPVGPNTYLVTPSVTFGKMLNDFAAAKFTTLQPGSPTVVAVKLTAFSLEEANTDSSGHNLAVGLLGGEKHFQLTARFTLTATLTKPGATPISKTITGSAEEQWIQGIGTGTATSNAHRGADSQESVHGRNINSAANKALMFLNKFLEEQGL